MIGKTLAHFRVIGKLGEGGMGEVYRAEDSKLGREVALKVLPAAFVEDADRMARFGREAQVLLNNPELLKKIEASESRLGRWLQTNKTNAMIVELLYLSTLSRRPTQAEQELAAKHLQTSGARSTGLRDLQHALLMSNEFLLRH